MALDINGYNKTFNTFVEFAESRRALNKPSSVARCALKEGALSGYEISATTTDKAYRLTRRPPDEKRANDAARNLFKKAVADMFGGMAKVPPSVVKAMQLSDYGEGRPLTARRILIVKNAIDAEGSMREQGVSQFRDAATREAALAMGYSAAELPKLARATNFYAAYAKCEERNALAVVTTPGSTVNRLMNYGGRFLNDAKSFARGVDLINAFEDWFTDLVDTMKPVNMVRASKRDYSSADTPTKLNTVLSILDHNNLKGMEKFVFEELASNPAYNLNETDPEKLFGAANNAATRFLCRGFGDFAYTALANIPPAKRSVIYAVFDKFTRQATNANEAHDQALGVGHLTEISSGNRMLFLSRILRHFDEAEAMYRQGTLTAKNILDRFFPDIVDKGNYDYKAVNKYFDDLAVMLMSDPEDGNIYHDVAKYATLLMNSTGSTIEEAAQALREHKTIPPPKYLCGATLPLSAFDCSTQSEQRDLLAADLVRPQNYAYLNAKDKLLVKDANAGFGFMFPDGSKLVTNQTEEGKGNVATVMDKITALCGKCHAAQINSLMMMVSQSGLSPIKGGLPSIACNEHAAVDFTLSKSAFNGDVMIRYSSPKELPFAFEWTATVKADGTVIATPLRFTDEQTLKATISTADTAIKTYFAGRKLDDRESLENAINFILDSAKTDPDLIRLLQMNNFMVIQDVLSFKGNDAVDLAKVARKLESLRGNLNELRMAANGDKRTFKLGLEALAMLNGRSFKPGVITKMFAVAKTMDFSALKNISAASSSVEIAKVLCMLEIAMSKILPQSVAEESLGALGLDDVATFSCMVQNVIFSQCDERTLRGFREGMYSQNAANLFTAISDFDDAVDNEAYPEGMPRELAIATNRAALRLDQRIGKYIGNLLDGALGLQPAESPRGQEVSPAEYKAILKVIQDHTIQEHQDEIEDVASGNYDRRMQEAEERMKA